MALIKKNVCPETWDFIAFSSENVLWATSSQIEKKWGFIRAYFISIYYLACWRWGLIEMGFFKTLKTSPLSTSMLKEKNYLTAFLHSVSCGDRPIGRLKLQVEKPEGMTRSAREMLFLFQRFLLTVVTWKESGVAQLLILFDLSSKIDYTFG